MATPFTFTDVHGADTKDVLNLLENPGAEEDLSEEPVAPWHDGATNALPAGWSYATDNPRTGAKSLKAVAASNNLYLYNGPLRAVHPGNSYYYEVFVEATSSGVGSGTLRVGVEWYNAAKAFLSRSETTSPPATSYDFIFVTITAPANAAYALPYLRLTSFTSGDEWWIDDTLLMKTWSGRMLDPNSSSELDHLTLQELYVGRAEVDLLEFPGATSGSTTLEAQAVASGALTLPNGSGTLALTSDVAAAAFTDEKAQDAVGGILADDGHIDFTYDDATPKITADIKASATPTVAALTVAGNLTLDAAAGAGVASIVKTTKDTANVSNVAFHPASGTNVNQSFQIIPKGTGVASNVAQFSVFGTDYFADSTNFEAFSVRATGSQYSLISSRGGTGTIRPIQIFPNGVSGIYIAAAGEVGINTASPVSGTTLDVADTTGGILNIRRVDTSVTANDMVGKIQFYAADTSTTTNFVVADIEAQAVNTVTTDINPGRLIFRTTGSGVAATPSERMRITADGNVKIAGSASRATTEGTNHLDIFDGTAPVGTLANGVSLYSSAGELRVLDALGNSTLLSPHSKADNAWIYNSKDVHGRTLTIEVEKILRFVNDKYKLGLIKEVTE